MSEFEYEDVIYDWDEYKLGETVEVRTERDNADGSWSTGTLVSIDYDDPALPWGVSHGVLTPDQYEITDEGNDLITDEGWDWIRPNNIRRPDFVIQEEEDEPQMAVSW